MSRTLGVHCLRNGCIALAATDSVYCIVHRDYEALFRLWDAVPAVPSRFTDRYRIQIERDADGLPVRMWL